MHTEILTSDREALIDLDVEPEQPASGAAGPPRAVVARWWRVVAAALACLLALSVGGAEPFPPPPVRQVHVTPFDSADHHQIIDDLLITSTPLTTTDRPERRITAFDLTNGRSLWSWDVIPEHPDLAEVGPVVMSVSGGVLLVTVPDEDGGTRTTAVDPRTGRHRWSVPFWLYPLPDERIAFVFENIFPPGSRIAHDRVRSEQEIYVSSDGRAYTEPPIGLVVRAVDLETGQLRWETPQLTAAMPALAGGDQPTILLTMPADGGVEVRDAATGTVRHRLDWPIDETIDVERVGDVVVVSRAGNDPGATVYQADLRRRLWSRSLPGPNPYLTGCGPVLCWPDTDTGTVAFDPATGKTLWRLPEQADLFSIGSRLVQVDGGWRFRRIIDPWTGRSLGDLTGWRLADYNTLVSRVDGTNGTQVRTDLPPLLLRLDAATQQTELGLFDADRSMVRSLGVLPYTLDQCVLADRFLACQTMDGQLRVLRYELPRTYRR